MLTLRPLEDMKMSGRGGVAGRIVGLEEVDVEAKRRHVLLALQKVFQLGARRILRRRERHLEKMLQPQDACLDHLQVARQAQFRW